MKQNSYFRKPYDAERRDVTRITVKKIKRTSRTRRRVRVTLRRRTGVRSRETSGVVHRAHWRKCCGRLRVVRVETGGRVREETLKPYEWPAAARQRTLRVPTTRSGARPSTGTGAPTGGAGSRRWRRRARIILARRSAATPRAGTRTRTRTVGGCGIERTGEGAGGPCNRVERRRRRGGGCGGGGGGDDPTLEDRKNHVPDGTISTTAPSLNLCCRCVLTGFRSPLTLRAVVWPTWDIITIHPRSRHVVATRRYTASRLQVFAVARR